MISFNDDELQMLLRAAAVIPEPQRAAFLCALAVEMRKRPKDVFAHVCADVQRKWIGWLVSNPCVNQHHVATVE